MGGNWWSRCKWKNGIESSKSHELGREEHLGKRVSAPEHEFPVPKNEIPSIKQKVVGVLFRCQKVSYL